MQQSEQIEHDENCNKIRFEGDAVIVPIYESMADKTRWPQVPQIDMAPAAGDLSMQEFSVFNEDVFNFQAKFRFSIATTCVSLAICDYEAREKQMSYASRTKISLEERQKKLRIEKTSRFLCEGRIGFLSLKVRLTWQLSRYTML